MLEIWTKAPNFSMPDQNGAIGGRRYKNGIIMKGFDKIKAADTPAQTLGELQ